MAQAVQVTLGDLWTWTDGNSLGHGKIIFVGRGVMHDA
jgi:hypothetical protein